MSKFKAGDFVYYPARGTQVFQLEDSSGFENYPICIYFGDNGCKFETFTPEGFAHLHHKFPQIWHATRGKQARLERFYGEEFDEPPAPTTSHAIVREMLDRGDYVVPCWVSDEDDEPDMRSESTLIIGLFDDGGFMDWAGNNWTYVTPFDLRTGEAITELPE